MKEERKLVRQSMMHDWLDVMLQACYIEQVEGELSNVGLVTTSTIKYDKKNTYEVEEGTVHLFQEVHLMEAVAHQTHSLGS